MIGRLLASAGLAAGIALSPGMARAAATFYGPTPYLSAADSPFQGLGSLVLEDFEDGTLNIPGVSSTPGGVVLGPGAQTDSVDADDGAIDGSGTAGHSLLMGVESVTFAFDAGVIGRLPTHVGVVWTDVGLVTTGAPGFAGVSFEAFGPGGAPLGVLGPVTVGDGTVTGATAEDRFFGVSDPAGISAIRLSVPNSNDWELDHLQYLVPEPAFLGTLIGALSVARRRR